MVHARIHIICGNCGATIDDMSLVIERDEDLGREDGALSDSATIRCDNCSTLHFLHNSMRVSGSHVPPNDKAE